MRITRERWLDEGLAVLAEDGVSGLRIDRLAARLGVTKGSFHHHFAGAPGFKTALLASYETRVTGALAAALTARADEGTRSAFARLTELATGGSDLRDPRLDSAMRAWAQSDVEVREMQARIDAGAVGALQAAWRPLVDSDEKARAAALVPYLISLGAGVSVPPVEGAELRSVYELLLGFVPAADASTEVSTEVRSGSSTRGS